MSTMSLLGSEIVQTPAMAHHDDPDSFVSVTKRLLDANPNAISMNQVTRINCQFKYSHEQ